MLDKTRNSIFVWILLGTGLMLLIPLIAMQFTDEVSWDTIDFIAMGILLFVAGSLYVLASRRVVGSQRVFLGILFAIVFLYIWAELAVGIFTNPGA